MLITYQELAKALHILPPHSIHQVTEALERVMEEDAAADRSFIAALAISKTRGGLPSERIRLHQLSVRQ
jgi:alpha-D-ribose 1-methylphosphonate 5-triphosphate synthase subunit PhnI